jgi:hypothetical protein
MLAKLQAFRGLNGLARDAAKLVGFSVFPASLDEFVEIVLENANARQAEIEAVFSNREAGR